MEEELRRVVAARDELMAIVSHDLRNPLSAVQLSTRLLGDLGLDERARKHVEMIQRATRSMSRLIEDLLDAVSIDSGNLALDVRPVRVADLMTEVHAQNEAVARDRAIELHVDCEARPGTRDLAILCDRTRVLQVFGNLITNAAAFCRTGGAVLIGCQVAGDAVEFKVADTGPGIDPGLVPHLFDPYWSAPPIIRRRIGLALYIAKGIVERHGGRIRVERGEPGSGPDPRPDAGPAIAFTIPRAKAP